MTNLLLKEYDWLYFLVFIIPFFIFLYTTPSAITLEDDGLFIMSGYFSGIAHPPGYPLYSLVGKIFSLIPIGSIPFRMHMLSSFFGASTCLVIALIIRTLVPSSFIAIMAGVAFAFTRQFWAQSIIAEVYTLNAFLLFLLLYLLIKLNKNDDELKNSQSASLIIFLFGLSLTLHWPLVVLSTPALAVLAWPVRKKIASKPLEKIFLFILSLTPYVWMIWRSNSDVLISFYGPVQSFSDFWYVFTRQGFVTVDVSSTAGYQDKIAFFNFMLEELVTQYQVIGFGFVAYGFVMQWRLWSLSISMALLLLFLGHTVSFQILLFFDYDDLNKAVISVYPLVAYGVMAIWMALGIFVVSRFVSQIILRQISLGIISGIIGGGVICIIFTQNYSINNRSEYSFANNYAETVLENLPLNTDLFVDGDIPTFTIGYKHYVEKIRPDINLFSTGGIVFSNRLFDPVKTDEEVKLSLLQNHVEQSSRPVCTTSGLSHNASQIDSWLFNCIDTTKQVNGYQIDLSDEIKNYFYSLVLDNHQTEAWTVHFRQQLLKKSGAMMGRTFAHNLSSNMDIFDYHYEDTDEFFVKLGYLEGVVSVPTTDLLINRMIRVLKEGVIVPPGAKKEDRSRFYALRGVVSEKAGNLENAAEEYQTSIQIWPNSKNESILNLLGIFTYTKNREAYTKLKEQVYHMVELREGINQYNLVWDRTSLPPIQQ